jgi:uncharacterized protein YndB with AHSA1/START domain
MTPDRTSAASPTCSFNREFNSPAEQVFEAWTDPALLAQWWGPHGFTNPVCEFEPRPGGGIRIDMRGPDGVVYQMTGAVEEVDAPRKLVFTSAALDETGRAVFKVRTVVELAGDDGHTSLSLQAFVIGKTSAAAQFLAGMEGGWTQSLERLEALLGTPREIVSTRIFNAPRAVVFEAFRDPEQLAGWWGPKGFTNTFEIFEPKSGGRWRFVMHGPDGADYPNAKDFITVIPDEKIVLKHLDPAHGFLLAMTYADEGRGTRLIWRMRFDSASESAKLFEVISAKNEENFDRLEQHLMKRGALAG